MIVMMLQFPEIIPEIERSNLVPYFESPTLQEIGQEILKHRQKPVSEIISAIQNETERSMAAGLAMEDNVWNRDGCLKLITQFEHHRSRKENNLLEQIKSVLGKGNERFWPAYLEPRRMHPLLYFASRTQGKLTVGTEFDLDWTLYLLELAETQRLRLAHAEAREGYAAVVRWMGEKPGRRLPESLDSIYKQYYQHYLAEDPWGAPYRVVKGKRKGEFAIVSDGPDGLPDTDDDIAYDGSD